VGDARSERGMAAGNRGRATGALRQVTGAAAQALASHWREYLIEAWALGTFMVSASVFTTVLEFPNAPLHQVIVDPTWRLALIGLAMGSTAVALIYSPWGRRSGAHMNPSVTLAFLSLGRISKVDAAFYILAQFIGGLVGVLICAGLLGQPFAQPPVTYIVTVPGAAGPGVAFVAEAAISFVLMFAILEVSNSKRWGQYSGLVAGLLITCYVTFEAPISGMSMNPARTLASAWPAGNWSGWWIYFTAPCLGMWLAARVFHVLTPWVERTHHSAKVVHTAD
jgi:aquaporin Z